MDTITARSFYYKASRDIISTVIGSLLAIVIFFIIRYALPPVLCLLNRSLSVEDNNLLITFLMIIHLIISIYWFIRSIISIHSHSYSQLRITQNEIVYRYGKSAMTTLYIPANKIHSCSKHSTVLQRRLNVSTISITTGNKYSNEIRFESIEYGERAYELLCKIIAKNKASVQHASHKKTCC